MSNPLISVGVASYNNAAYIAATLDSIRALDYTPLELIVVDDASTDNSVEIIEQWLTAHPEVLARLIKHPTNQGVCRVCNRLVAEAQGEFLAMIGSDDLYKPAMLTSSLQAIWASGPKCGAVYADCELIDKQGRVLADSFLEYFNARFGPHYPAGNIRVSLLNGFYLPAPTVLLRLAALLETGPYDDHLHAEDLDMWLRLCENWEFAFLPEKVSSYRVHQLSASQSNKPRLNETFFQIYRKTQFSLGAELTAAKRMLIDHAEHYYNSQGSAAGSILWFAFRETRDPKILAFWLMARLGVKYATLHKLFSR